MSVLDEYWFVAEEPPTDGGERGVNPVLLRDRGGMDQTLLAGFGESHLKDDQIRLAALAPRMARFIATLGDVYTDPDTTSCVACDGGGYAHEPDCELANLRAVLKMLDIPEGE